MLCRRSAVLSVGRDSRTFQPILALWLFLAASTSERLFDQIETLVEAIATHHRIMRCRRDTFRDRCDAAGCHFEQDVFRPVAEPRLLGVPATGPVH